VSDSEQPNIVQILLLSGSLVTLLELNCFPKFWWRWAFDAGHGLGKFVKLHYGMSHDRPWRVINCHKQNHTDWRIVQHD